MKCGSPHASHFLYDVEAEEQCIAEVVAAAVEVVDGMRVVGEVGTPLGVITEARVDVGTLVVVVTALVVLDVVEVVGADVLVVVVEPRLVTFKIQDWYAETRA